MANIDQLLGGKRAFAQTGARRNVPEEPFIPRQNLYLVTCAGRRGDRAQAPGIELGQACVRRAVAGRLPHAVATARAGAGRCPAW